LFLARSSRLLDFYARVGSSGLADYYGVGARALGVPAGERVTLGGELDVWRQPEILLGERGVHERPYRVGMNAGVLFRRPPDERRRRYGQAGRTVSQRSMCRSRRRAVAGK
jgi:hypothetical protein